MSKYQTSFLSDQVKSKTHHFTMVWIEFEILLHKHVKSTCKHNYSGQKVVKVVIFKKTK